MYQTFDIPSTFIVTKIENHQDIKKQILDAISSMPINSFEDNFSKIYNTDFYLDKKIHRPYVDFINPIVNQVFNNVLHHLNLDKKHYSKHANIQCWFQQYSKNDYHKKHIHPHCSFSNIYYIDLDTNNPKTSFHFRDTKAEAEIKEGDVLTFSSNIPHESKPNLSDKIKTIISWNLL